ncbi:MAG: hypothetical protein EOO50_12405 [Flavobacterium sp.]|uniref:hypothetical protein n=1 Tax=Flavobacterium sp. TaxID=239 RepID=UPI00121C9371|nr:hypothetical protein [Flavobacterium sp.]RZJ65809.1 MAG: hypothetical protein EOO50_12405 [Flavobacterium sp.]
MTTRHVLTLFAVFAAIAVEAQSKELSFTGYKTGNSNLQWNKPQRVNLRKAYFSDEKIEFHIDRVYKLSVVKKTDLPNNGVVYICKDQMQQEVTVTLISNQRMFLYCEGKRFEVDFNSPLIPKTREMYADVD